MPTPPVSAFKKSSSFGSFRAFLFLVFHAKNYLWIHRSQSLFFFLRRINATKIERSCDKIWAKSKSLITACTCKPSNFLLRLIIFVFQNIKFARATIGSLDVETKMVLFFYDSPILLIQLITWRDSVHPSRETISHSTRPRKIPRWIVLVRVNFFYKQTYLQQIKKLKLY